MGGRADVVSLDVFDRFRPFSGTVPAGFYAHYLGDVTRAEVFTIPEEKRARCAHERFESFAGPPFDDGGLVDCAILLEAIVEARGEFTMLSLGAGWGRWLVAAACAARQREHLRVRLVGVEAEPTHFRWIHQHFRDNQIDPAAHDLVEAAIWTATGEVWFYVGKSDSWYGQSIIRDDALEPDPELVEIDYRGERARRVKTIELPAVTAKYQRIDYLQLDVQGVELDVLASRPDILDEKVKRINVGTHTHEIEAGLRELFTGRGWHCQYDFPLHGRVPVAGGSVLNLVDGIQLWINPAL
jgi:FkbM family methyltransferase